MQGLDNLEKRKKQLRLMGHHLRIIEIDCNLTDNRTSEYLDKRVFRYSGYR